MNDTANKSSIGVIPRIVLLVASLILVTILFFLKGGINKNSPLDELARRSLDPAIALANGKPSFFEFYADWCEVCNEMAPAMLSLERRSSAQINFVLLNVDNPLWQDYLNLYEVHGIPQLNFFDEKGNLLGVSIGLRNEQELEQIKESLIGQAKIPSFSGVKKLSNIQSISSLKSESSYTKKIAGPKSHS